MPRVLILFHGAGDGSTRIAEAIAEGAESVKFTEVELRRIDASAPASGGSSTDAKHRALESWDAVAGYDAVIVSARGIGGLPEEMGALGRGGALAGKVGAVVAGEGNRLAAELLGTGMIVVGPPPDGGVDDLADDVADARRHGARVATVAEWIRHAKSHEHHHGHSHAR